MPLTPHTDVPLGSIKAGSAIDIHEFANVQSCDFCVILQMIIAQDSNKVYEEDFHDLFEFSKGFKDHGASA